MTRLLLVALGGAVGSVLRYLVAGWVQRAANGDVFPYGTLVVNVAGCLLIGLLAGVAETRAWFSPEMRLLLMVGLLGGFTTFSTFGYESFQLLRGSETMLVLANVGVSVVAGMLAVWLGYTLARAL